MDTFSISPRSSCRLLLLGLSLSLVGASAAEVTVSLVTKRDGERVPLEPSNELRRSPYGGWVTVMWPFNMTAGGVPILEYKSELLEQAWAARGKEEEAAMTALEEDEAFRQELGLEGPAVVPGIKRSSSAKVTLGEGTHLVMPGDLRFTIEKGRLGSDDPRVKTEPIQDLVEVLCWPVTIRAFDESRSVAAPIVVSYGGVDLVEGVLKPLEDPEKRKRPQKDEEQDGRAQFRRIVMYLPPTTGGKSYRLNGLPFSIGADGKVKLPDTEHVVLAGDAELRLKVPPGPPVRLVGRRWLAPQTARTVEGHPYLPMCPRDSTAMPLPVPLDEKEVSVEFEMGRARPHSVTVANTFYDLPYKTVMFHRESGRSYVFETADFTVPPGGRYSCRLLPMWRGSKPEQELPCRFTPLYRDGESVETKLTGSEGGRFSGQLPDAVSEGLWQIVHAGAWPLRNWPLAMICVTKEKTPATVSVYTYRNRAGFVRGDRVDIYWTVRTPEGAAPIGEFEIRLEGACLKKTIARDADAGSRSKTGHVRIDTAGLAPGLYQVRVQPETLVSYPAHFFLYQREQETDYGINSYAPFGETPKDAGAPITTYYGQGSGADEPGLEPLMDHARSGLDAAFASYAGHPAGPVAEKFIRPSEDEVGLMTLARLGRRVAMRMPVQLHHEEWNPKHTLPEELRRLRRRNALFTQKHADLSAFCGINLNWYATLHGYWEEVERLDGHQQRRSAEAGKWVSARIAEHLEAEKRKNPDPKHFETIQKQAGTEFWSRVLPAAYKSYLADAKVIRPGLTSHTGIPTFWMGGGAHYPPNAYSTLSHRDSVDYTDYGRPPWSNFRGPAFLNMNNPQGQKTQMATAAGGRHARFIVAFGAAGRGLDGFAFPSGLQPVSGDHEQLLRIFQRYGSYFTSLAPLPDVAVYFSKATGWGRQKNVILHDLARLRRPGMLLAEEDVLRGELDKYNVLFLGAVGEHEIQAVRDAFEKFEKRGGVIIKDQTVAKSYPGIDLGFAYDGDQLHKGWGLAYPNGEWEFAHLWTNFLKTREEPLLKAFGQAPDIPVTTSDREIVISPLAGKESICCFVINVTYVPMSVQGKWRQHAALPRKADLIVEEGWHVRDLLAGTSCELAEKSGKRTVEMDFTRAEGRLYLLTKREPKAMAIRVRQKATELLLDAWLEDGEGKALPDPMPFEVTLSGPGGENVLHKFASLWPDRRFAITLPEVSQPTELKLTVKDLVIGCRAEQTIRLSPLVGAGVALAPNNVPDVIGRRQVVDFIKQRKNRVIVLLDEGQGRYRAAAEAMVALLKESGRDARLKVLDAAEVREQPLRWKWTEEDQEALKKISAGELVAWRVGLAPFDKEFDDPLCGYDEYGPRTWIDGDAVLFGGPKDNRALADLEEFLRRKPSENYPSPGRFFVHYVWDPFLGECDGLYVGCNDPAGAEAAVRYLTELEAQDSRQDSGESDGTPLIARGRTPSTPEDLLHRKFGTKILDAAYAPSGDRVFVSVDSYGDSFLVLDPEGSVIESRPIGNRFWHSLWFAGGGALRPLSDEELFLRIGSNDFRYSLKDGFLSKTASPPHGLPGRVRVTPGGPVLHQDHEHQRTYLGGKSFLHALDGKGNLLWRYVDADHRTGTNDMLHRRSIFIRGVSPNGKRLLATAFGVAQDVYSIGSPQNMSIFCMDTDSGQVMWSKNGLYLNQGKALLTDDRFVIVDDDGQFHVLNANTGDSVGQFRAVGGTDFVLPVPKTEFLLVVENNQFDRHGPSNLAYLRAPGDKPDITLDLPGRIRSAVLTRGGRRIIMSSRRGSTACFALDGRKNWEVPIPQGGGVRFSPDGKTTLVGSEVGDLFFLETETGKVIRTIDFNPYNVTTPEQYLKQMGSVGDVPVAKTARVPPAPPEPSYLDSLDKSAVGFGQNLLGREVLLRELKPGAPSEGDPAEPKFLAELKGTVEFKLKLEPKSTYLVEFLNASTVPELLTPDTRLEVKVVSPIKSKQLPFIGRLPIESRLTRRRMAFRTENDREVTLSMRVVIPTTQGEGRRARKTYEPSQLSAMPMLIGDTVVSAMKFQSRNFLKVPERSAGALAAGDEAPSPRGWVELMFHRWSGGSSQFKKWRWEAPQRALGLVDGVIGNQETKWQEARDAVTGTSINYATAKVTFEKPETITAVAIYEDNRGPSLSRNSVKEMTTMHFAIYINKQRFGYAVNNTNLVNIFTFPAMKTKELQYFWSGREFTGRTDGMIRTAELEVYSTEEAGMDFDEAGDAPEEGEEGADEGLDLDVLE